jgi:ribosomal protein L4
MPEAKYLATEGLNVYDVLDHERLIMTRSTLDAVTQRLKGKPRTEEGAA